MRMYQRGLDALSLRPAHTVLGEEKEEAQDAPVFLILGVLALTGIAWTMLEMKYGRTAR